VESPSISFSVYAADYARAREIAYPVTKEFIEAYTEKEIDGDSTKWDAYVIKRNKVRTDNPK
jgi:UDP-galactopyranose mutase